MTERAREKVKEPEREPERKSQKEIQREPERAIERARADGAMVQLLVVCTMEIYLIVKITDNTKQG